MGLLLLLVGLLAVASGAIKLRPHVRSLLGRSSLAVTEIVLGAATVGASGVGLSRVRPLAWAVVAGALGLTLVSSLAYMRRALRHGQGRKASEEARLESHLGSLGDLRRDAPGERANLGPHPRP